MRRATATLGLGLLCLAGCAKVLGIDPDRYLVRCEGTVPVKILYDITGPTRDVSPHGGKATEDYLRRLNDEGGLRGCQLEIEVGDTRYDKAAALEVYQAWQAKPEWSRVPVIFAGGTPVIQTIAPLTAQDEKVIITLAQAGEFGAPQPAAHDVMVPTLNSSFSEALIPARKQSPGYPTVFFAGTDYTTSARLAASFAWRSGAQRLGFFYCSTSGFCSDPVDGAKTFLKVMGGQTKVGRDLHVELSDTEELVEQKVLAYFQQELDQKAKDGSYAMVDWVWFGNTRITLTHLGRALHRVRSQLGLEVKVIGNTFAVDEGLYAQCGEPCLGFFGMQSSPAFGDLSVPGMAALVENHQAMRQRDGEAPELYRTMAYVQGYVAAKAFQIAAERVLDAGKPLTGAALKESFESFANVQIDGFATVSATPTDHRPQSTARVFKVLVDGVEQVGQPSSVPLEADWLGW
ncbi:MAG: ABC transporter substrate-binding protein [Deltaproteobacteria bacterium]|nr:ABC transporter substrate-binding protein [Deltaproteobacteria bacterium]